ncbi:MAG: DUF6206 family protein [Actinomycetota bacterium]
MRAELNRLEAEAHRAIESGDAATLHVIDFGEISTVLPLSTPDGEYVAKRLPPFPAGTFEHYATTFDRYLTVLADLGTTPVDSHLEVFGGDPSTAYAIQPFMPTLLVRQLRDADEGRARMLSATLANIVADTVSPTVGLDAQVSNWAITEEGTWRYLDVTTPMLRDASGQEELELGIFIASLPAALRPVIRRFALTGILDAYYDRRNVLLDVAANLHKERLTHHSRTMIEEFNRVIDTPLTETEAARYYRSNAFMWEALQRLRLMDRWWQRRVRRRPYPFLLPGKVNR